MAKVKQVTNISEVVTSYGHVLKKDWSKVLLLCILKILLLAAVIYVPYGLFILIILWPVVTVALIDIISVSYSKKPTNIVKSFTFGLKRWPYYMTTTLVWAIFLFPFYLALKVPGWILYIYCIFTDHAVTINNYKNGQAIHYSMKLTEGRWTSVFLTQFLILMPIALVMFPVSRISIDVLPLAPRLLFIFFFIFLFSGIWTVYFIILKKGVRVRPIKETGILSSFFPLFREVIIYLKKEKD